MNAWWMLLFVSRAASLVAPPSKVAGRLSGRRKIAIRTTLEIPSGGGLAVPQRCTVASFWGVAGVMAMLVNAVKRVFPVAVEPFQTGLSPPLWIAYGIFALGMCYAEGYKAFHLKFSPMVVSRSMTLGRATGTPLLHSLFAPLYAMGLFHASGKRTKTSWGFIVGIFALVKLVKKLDYPWRAIVDGGVVVGLSVGTFSIAYHYFRAIFLGIPAPADPELPTKTSSP